MTETGPSDRWRRLQALCDAVEHLPAAEQAQRLVSLEPDDGVRREALDLLDAIRCEAEAQRQNHEARRVPGPVIAPDAIGGVRILEHIGSGGSGEVFRGIRNTGGVEQVVAVKRFHAHRTSNDDLQRFAREQQLLARLTHPDIVRYFDGGVGDDGRPYLVMEHVEGEPITTYADRHRLGLRARLVLWLCACDAVQSAHQQLVVHLDLKPSNVLVSTGGRVKLLDFGTAKLADPEAGLTRTEPLTLLYASPERLRGEPVSVACDVFSLGLVLYELTSGGWPFRRNESLVSLAERAAGHAPPAPLSRVVTAAAADCQNTSIDRLRAALGGDLEAIAGKAVTHEPHERYATVADMAADLRRYLDGVPVAARTPSVAYRASKFVRRRAREVAGVLLLIVALTAAAFYSAGQARVARREAARAQIQNRFLTYIFTLAGSDAASRHDMTVRELLALAEERIEPSLGRAPLVAADVESTLAYGYLSQNAFPDARRLLDRAIERAAANGDAPREAEARAHRGYVSYVENRRDDALADVTRALALWQAHSATFPAPQAVATLRMAASTLSYVNTTDPTFTQYFERCVEIAATAPDDIPPADRAQCLRGLAIAYTNVQSRYDEADQLLREAAALQRPDRLAAVPLSATLQMLGLVNRHRGQFAEDERAQREAYDILSRLQGPDGVAPLWQRAVWASSLLGVGRHDEAYREASAVLAAARTIYPERGSYLLWTPLISTAGAACLTGRDDECDALAAEAIETLGTTPAPDDPRLHTARGLRGVVLARRGRRDEARPLLDAARASEAARKRVSAFTPLWSS